LTIYKFIWYLSYEGFTFPIGGM